MYTVVKAYGKAISEGNRWTEVTIENQSVNQLLREYRRIYIVLRHPTVKHLMTLDVEKMRSFSADLSLPFPELLTSIGNRALPTINKVPLDKKHYVRYQDAFRAGYNVQPVNKAKSPDADIPRGDKTSLMLTREGLDFREFGKYVMVAVNGYFHMVETSDKAAWVLDGMKSQFHCGENLLGLLSFKEIGQIKHVPIRPEMLYKLNTEDSYRTQMAIDFGEDISDKTVLLVMGGYLYALDSRIFRQVSDTAIVVNVSAMDLPSRYQESMEYLDFSSLPYERSSRNESMLNVDNFMADENLVAYATLSQSFAVLVDNAELFAEKEYVKSPPTPKVYETTTRPIWPLFQSNGRMAHYWSVWEDGVYALKVGDKQWRRFQFETIDQAGLTAISDSEITEQPVRHSQAFFLKIGSDLSLIDAQ